MKRHQNFFKCDKHLDAKATFGWLFCFQTEPLLQTFYRLRYRVSDRLGSGWRARYHAGMTPDETRKALRQLQADAMALHTQTMRLRATPHSNLPQVERLHYWATMAAGAIVGATISFCLLR